MTDLDNPIYYDILTLHMQMSGLQTQYK